MFISDTPNNINDYEIDDVIKLLDEKDAVKNQFIPSARVRLNYMKMLYDLLGYTMSPDVALASVSEPQASLVLSTAGGGKTTWSQIKAIEQKLIRKRKNGKGQKISGDKILCLVYNVHNVKQMTDRHEQMVARLMTAGVDGLQIDSNINACTMHSFCEFCRKLFIARLGLLGFTLAEKDYELEQYMSRAYKLYCKINKIEIDTSVPMARLHDLNVLTKETLKPVSELQETDCFEDVGLEVEVIEAIFQQYESIKKKSRKYEFIDILYDVYNLLKKDKVSLKQVQRYYDYVIADEVQDFTPLMWNLLQLFVNDDTPLTCIGDEDQNIYSFRGASIENVLTFKDRFPDGKVYFLGENRRCSKQILNEAKRVIEQNKLRFGKKIYGYKEGGEISLVPYSTEEGQIINVVREIKKLSIDERNNTVICYRNSDSSTLLSEMLAENNISINCIRANAPYSHELYGHFLEILNALEMPRDRNYYKSLYKVLPCKKTEWFAAINYNPEMRKFTTPDDKISFTNLNYGHLMNYRGFSDAIKILKDISDMLPTAPMNRYFTQLSHMLYMYFWNYKRSLNGNDVLDDIFEKRVKKLFNTEKRYSEVFREIQTVKSICESDTKIGNGVALATFHSLKGLEFDRVIVVDLEDTIFPNYALIDYKKYSQKTTQELKEAETRLWYVAVTRAKSKLILYYNEDNPSKYIVDYLESTGNEYKGVQSSNAAGIVLDESQFVAVNGITEDTSESCDKEAVDDDFIDDDFLDADFTDDSVNTIQTKEENIANNSESNLSQNSSKTELELNNITSFESISDINLATAVIDTGASFLNNLVKNL